MSPKKLLGTIFTGMGAIFLTVAAVFLVRDLRFDRTAVTTTGEVVALRSGGSSSSRSGKAPDIAFTTFDGQQRVHRSNVFSTPSYQIGEKLPIAYDPADPDNAAIDTFFDRKLFPILFGAIGLVEFSVGMTFLTLRRRRKQEIERLFREGQRLDARVVQIEQNTRIRVNRKHPWLIRLEATLPGESAPRTFTSRNLWFDPTPVAHGRELPVYYDPRDPARHVVDTRNLPLRRT